MTTNHSRVGRALYLLKIDLDNFVPREFLAHHGDETPNALQQILGQYRDTQKPFQSMKAQDMFTVMQSSWWDVFDRRLGGIEPSLVRELALAHEAWSNRQSFTPEATFQVLTSIQRLLAAMSSPSTLELDMLKAESLDAEAESGEIDRQESAGDRSPPSGENPTQAVSQATIQNPPPPAAPGAEGQEVSVIDGAESPLVVDAPTENDSTPGAVDDTEQFLSGLIHALQGSGALRDEDAVVQATRSSPAASEAGPEMLQGLSPALAQSLADAGFDHLLAYQLDLAETVVVGDNAVLTVPLGEDPGLAVAMSIAERLLRNPDSDALVICPNEPRARRLMSILDRLLSPLNIAVSLAASPAPEEGASAAGERQQRAHVLSVEALNGSLMADSGNWENSLGRLGLVVLDSSHEYRGSFGAHVAVLLRRLSHLLSILGAHPVYLAWASGCVNGAELAENLAGKPFRQVSAGDGPEGKRHFISVELDPAVADFHDEFVVRISAAVQTCLGEGKSVVVYAPDRILANGCFLAAREKLAAAGLDESLALLADSPSQDQDTSTPGIRPSDVRAVIVAGDPGGTTEDTGFDAAEFDGVILAGFPPVLREVLQRIYSVAGGPEKETFALCFALNDPHDRFLARNLPTLLDKQRDLLVADPENQEVIQSHLPSLVRESGEKIFSFSFESLGSAVFQELRRDSANLWSLTDTPQQAIDLFDGGEVRWSLVSDGVQVGSISDYRKFRETYEGAVMQVFGAWYRVAGSETATEDASAPVLLLEPVLEPGDFEVRPDFERAIEIQEESLCLSLTSGISLHLGTAVLEERLNRVDALHPTTQEESEQAGNGEEQNPVHSYTPDAYANWKTVAPAFWVEVHDLRSAGSGAADGEEASVNEPALRALEQMFRLGLLLRFPVDRDGIITCSSAGRVFMLERSPGCLGVVKRVFDHWRDLLEAGAELARQCPCERGCAYCIVPPFPLLEELDKTGGLLLADLLLEATASA